MTAPALTVQIQGQGSVSADNYNTFEQTCDTVAQLRALTGASGMQVFSRGISAVNDGGGGEFYWSATNPGPDDGVNVIVPTGAVLGAWVRLIFSAAVASFETQAAFVASSINATIQFAILSGHTTAGDAPPRSVFKLAAPPSPVQPWHLQTADGAYWQDTGPDIYAEWLGAVPNNTSIDNTTAFTNAWLAHLNLGFTLRVLGFSYYFASNMTWDINGFRGSGFQVKGAGKGRTQFIWLNTTSPSGTPQFTLYNSTAGSVFWGELLDIDFTTNVNGIGVQFGSNNSSAFNDCHLAVRSSNISTGSANIGCAISSWYFSHLDVRAGCNAVASGVCALQLAFVHGCDGIINTGNSNIGMIFVTDVNQNSFITDIEVTLYGIQSTSPTNEYNELRAGVINCGTGLGTNWAINNAGGSWLTIGRAVSISGNFTSAFANPENIDATWGGNSVKLDCQGQTFDLSSSPTIASATWFLNNSGQNVNLSFRGTGTISTLSVRQIEDYSSGGSVALENCVANGVTYRLQYGQSINVVYTGTVAWTWDFERQ